jgi:transposase InsO family protein
MDERMRMIMEHMEGGYSGAELARRFGVSRKTVSKWLGRFARERWEGLAERSRAPHHQARAIDEAVVEQILALKARWRLWGAPKLRHKLLEWLGPGRCPCESTVSNVLKRHGLTRKPRRRRRASGTGPLAQVSGANQVWCADMKGWFLTGDGKRCHPLTISDAWSRYLLCCEGLGGSTDYRAMRPHFIATFREYGLPEAMRTDNGPPFGSCGLGGLTPLAVWWMKLGIRLERIAPGHPEQNGRHERMHRTLGEATASPAQSTLRAQQEAFESFRQQYNQERPHEALDFEVPAQRYNTSPRAYAERKLPGMDYPQGWETRVVRNKTGQMTWRQHDVQVSSTLRGERVGLCPVEDGLWELYFGPTLLGHFDERQMKVLPFKRRHHQPSHPAACDEGAQAAPLRCAPCAPSSQHNLNT